MKRRAGERTKVSRSVWRASTTVATKKTRHDKSKAISSAFCLDDKDDNNDKSRSNIGN